MRMVIWCLCFLPLELVAVETSFQQGDLKRFSINIKLSEADLTLHEIIHGSNKFSSLSIGEGVDVRNVGSPAIPEIHRLIAVDPDKTYKVEYRVVSRKVVKGVLLAPVQPDSFEDEDARFVWNRLDYLRQKVWGGQVATVGQVVNVGPVTALPIGISAASYHGPSRTLTIHQEVEVMISSIDRDPDNYLEPGQKLTSFQREQVRGLILNQSQILASVQNAADRLLVITSQELLQEARRLEQIHDNSGVTFQFKTVASNTSSATLRRIIQDAYDEGNLDTVLLFGDENIIKLHWWTSYTPGDSKYTFTEGDDWYADIAISRIPASNPSEARFLMDKIDRYQQLRQTGIGNKKVMLVAHKESYPGKYTACMERVRQADNPLGLVFSTQYGGDGARSDDVVSEANLGYAIINYRGHGSQTAWSSWDYRSGSFGRTHVGQLLNDEEDMSIFLDITCNNGAIQRTEHSLAENLLFHGSAEGENYFRGAVAVLGSTVESQTNTNHKFNEYIFENFQAGEDISLGNVVGLANNRLVRDNGGSLPSNVRMYILFGDGKLEPWIK
jgi:hypothetical protein